MESKFLAVNKKIDKLIKNIRTNGLGKILTWNLHVYLQKCSGKNVNFIKKHLLHIGDSGTIKQLENWSKQSNRGKKCGQTFGLDFWKLVGISASSRRGNQLEVDPFWKGPKAKRKPKAVWVRTPAENAPRLSRAYADDKSEVGKVPSRGKLQGEDKRKKKTGEDDKLSNEPALPPPLRCRLSCPLPPPEFVPPASKDFMPPFRAGNARFSVLPTEFWAPAEETHANAQSNARREFSLPRKGAKRPWGDVSEWESSMSKTRKIYPSAFSPNPKGQMGQGTTETVPKMKALTFLPGNLSLEYGLVNAPTRIHKDEVLVEVRYSGVCGTDLFITEGKMSCGPGPLILGHEVSGKVYAAGSDVNQVKEGDSVVVNPYGACCTCRYCAMGVVSCCLNDGPSKSMGVYKDGGWSEYVVVKRSQITKVPTELGLEQAALVHPLSCVLSAFYKLDVPPGATVLIQGLGLAGCLWASVFHVHGHRSVFASDKSQRKRKRFLGLNLGYELTDADEMGSVGADVVIECTGSPASIEKCLKILNPNGQMCFFGKPNPTTEIRCTPYDIVSNEIRLLGSNGNGFCFSKAVNLAATMGYRYLDFHKLAIKVFELQDFREAFQMRKSGEISKIIFKMNT